MMRDRKEYIKAYNKAYRQSHKEERKAYTKVYNQAHKEERKAYNQVHKEESKAYKKAWQASNKDKLKAYTKSDVNSLGQTKGSIRSKSRRILKQMNLHIPGYQVHHCFGYDDPAKFIYISKSLHHKIHQYLRDNNIDASSDHWMQIRDIVNDTDEFTYIKA